MCWKSQKIGSTVGTLYQLNMAAAPRLMRLQQRVSSMVPRVESCSIPSPWRGGGGALLQHVRNVSHSMEDSRGHRYVSSGASAAREMNSASQTVSSSAKVKKACRYDSDKQMRKPVIEALTKEQAAMRDDDTKVTFGFETVSRTQKTQLVQDVFSRVADNYDFMNDLMSLGIQRWWKTVFVDLIDIPIKYNICEPSADRNDAASQFHLLDLAGGTGDISFRILQKYRDILPAGSTSFVRPQITVCDANEEMLRVGKSRADDANLQGLSWVCAMGEDLPFDNATFDVVTIAFGIRNFTNISKGLQEMYRILKPGGRLLCLEFSKVDNAALSLLYNFWSFQVIPLMGEVFAKDSKSYQYLVESIAKFPSQEEFAQIIWDAGFRSVSYMNLTGGIVATHSGYKLLG